jgi:AraC family transcriptional activator of tynA and feaB
LTKLETHVSGYSPPPPPLLDLAAVEEAQRAAIWSRTARAYFPGLSVRGLRVNPKVGSMCGMQFGAGRLWRILSPPLHVHYEPSDAVRGDDNDLSQLFSVMLQLEGSTVAHQDGRSCELGRYDFCVIDQRHPFDLEVVGLSSHLMFLQIPRETVLSRHPYLAQRTAERFDPRDAGAVLMRNVLLNLLETASYLEDEQRSAALNAIAQLLGSPKPPGTDPLDEVSWRARSALAYIDSSLSDSTLTASRVAQMQGISRRRLDEILLKTAGVSVTGQIWLRRLEQAAADLLDPRYASLTVTKIAFSVGFEDTAHFTRAFKRRYHCTPREWRRRGGGSVAPSETGLSDVPD